MSIKVELGFTAGGAGGPFLILDNPVAGQLDNTDWVLGGGEVLVDVTDFVRSLGINRGKSRDLDKYQAGQASVEFNNSLRTFDPTYEDSPFFGQIVPRRQIRITLDGVIAFEGIVDDWNLSYDASGISFAQCNAFDAFSALANIVISEPEEDYDDFPEETAGERVNRVLDFVSWNQERDITNGTTLLYEQLVPFGQGALNYLQLVTDSDFGDLFVGKDGKVVFRARGDVTGDLVNFSDDGVGIQFTGLEVVFGSEQLFNNITATNELDSASSRDAASIQAFGERDLASQTLIATESELQNYTDWLLLNYRNPEFRFETLQINLLGKTTAERETLADMEIGTPALVKFTPSGIGDPIERLSKVIGIAHQRSPQNEVMTIKLQTYPFTPFILDDATFGKLDSTSILSW
jgi:hypothetical protein